MVEPEKYEFPSTSNNVPFVVVAFPPSTSAIVDPPFGESVTPLLDVANLELLFVK
mgnify:CR=1 FL=1